MIVSGCQFEIDEFIEYCESRREDEFVYESNKNCALAQFLKDRGYCKVPIVDPLHYSDDTRPMLEYRYPAIIDQCARKSKTFGELALQYHCLMSVRSVSEANLS